MVICRCFRVAMTAGENVLFLKPGIERRLLGHITLIQVTFIVGY